VTLDNLKSRAARQRKAGQREQALNTTAQGLAIDPKDPGLLDLQTSLLRDAQAGATRMKQLAAKADAENLAPELFQQGFDRETNAVKLSEARNLSAATRSFWAAEARFQAAATESRRAQDDAKREPPAVPATPQERKAESDSRAASQKPAAEPTPPASTVGDAADQEGVRQTLRQYEAALSSLTIDAVRRVYPSAPASLQAELAGYRSYALRIEVDEFRFFSVGIVWATVHCRVAEDIQQKSGRRVQKDGSQIIKMQKQGQSWIIVSIQQKP
jgi:hypothetical protein